MNITIETIANLLEKKFPTYRITTGVGVDKSNLIMFNGEVMLSFPTKERTYNQDITEEVLNDYVRMVESMLQIKLAKKGDSII
jgi:hypothetical protein